MSCSVMSCTPSNATEVFTCPLTHTPHTHAGSQCEASSLAAVCTDHWGQHLSCTHLLSPHTAARSIVGELVECARANEHIHVLLPIPLWYGILTPTPTPPVAPHHACTSIGGHSLKLEHFPTLTPTGQPDERRFTQHVTCAHESDVLQLLAQ